MDSQGRIVIPAEIRKQMKLSDGDDWNWKMWAWSCFYANALPT